MSGDLYRKRCSGQTAVIEGVYIFYRQSMLRLQEKNAIILKIYTHTIKKVELAIEYMIYGNARWRKMHQNKSNHFFLPFKHKKI